MKQASVIFLLILIIYSCNPVQRVLKDPVKMNEMASEMIRRGYCSNDTTIINKVTDTVYVNTENSLDTLIMGQGICNFDTTLASGTRITFSNGWLIVQEKRRYKTRVITNVRDNFIRDRAYEGLLLKDIESYKDTVYDLRGDVSALQQTNKYLVERVSNFKLYLLGLILFLAAIFVFRLLKIVSRFTTPL